MDHHNIQIVRSFDADFAVKIVSVLNENMPAYFFGIDSRLPNSGLMLEFSSVSLGNWSGIFGWGTLATKGKSGIYYTPRRNWICVVAKGDAYIVNCTNPADWSRVELNPIVDVLCLNEQGLIILIDPWQMVAYDATGLRWTTRRLSVEGLEIVRVNSEFIKGRTLDGSEAEFQVNLLDGNSVVTQEA